jgi:hypothetical protein
MILNYFLPYPIAHFFFYCSFSTSTGLVLIFFIDPARSPSLGGVEFAIERVNTIKKPCVWGKTGCERAVFDFHC